jgi:hypothetical protein
VANELNATIAAISAALTVTITGYTAWVGARSKGRDQAQGLALSSYDNLQEDLRDTRAELIKERERADRLQAAIDGCYATVTALRVEHDEAIKREIARQQAIRHGYAESERRARLQLLRLKTWVRERWPDADLSFLDGPVRLDENLGEL